MGTLEDMRKRFKPGAKPEVKTATVTPQMPDPSLPPWKTIREDQEAARKAEAADTANAAIETVMEDTAKTNAKACLYANSEGRTGMKGYHISVMVHRRTQLYAVTVRWGAISVPNECLSQYAMSHSKVDSTTHPTFIAACRRARHLMQAKLKKGYRIQYRDGAI